MAQIIVILIPIVLIISLMIILIVNCVISILTTTIIITVLRDYGTPYYHPYEGLLVSGGTSQDSAFATQRTSGGLRS